MKKLFLLFFYSFFMSLSALGANGAGFLSDDDDDFWNPPATTATTATTTTTHQGTLSIDLDDDDDDGFWNSLSRTTAAAAATSHPTLSPDLDDGHFLLPPPGINGANLNSADFDRLFTGAGLAGTGFGLFDDNELDTSWLPDPSHGATAHSPSRHRQFRGSLSSSSSSSSHHGHRGSTSSSSRPLGFHRHENGGSSSSSSRPLAFHRFGGSSSSNRKRKAAPKVMSTPEGKKQILAYMKANPRLNLYAHQFVGISFLLANNEALLADDMGLGKTLQSILACRIAPEVKTVVILAPPGLRSYWASQIKKWLPQGSYRIDSERTNFDGTAAAAHAVKAKAKATAQKASEVDEDAMPAKVSRRTKASASAEAQVVKIAHAEPQKTMNFLILSQDWVRMDRNQARVDEIIKKYYKIDALIVDEVHRVSTGKKSGPAIKKFIDLPHKPKVILLSGTPIRQHVDKEIRALNGLLRNPLGWDWRLREGPQEHFARKTIRRTKFALEQSDATRFKLPPIQRKTVKVGLDRLSRQKYDMLKDALGIFRSTISLNMTQRLRQICITFDALTAEQRAQLLGEKSDYTVEELRKILEQINGSVGERIQEASCYICMEDFEDMEPSQIAYCLPCMHALCTECFAELKSRAQAGRLPQCGLCRGNIQKSMTKKEAEKRKKKKEEAEAEAQAKAQAPQVKEVPPKYKAVSDYVKSLPADEKIIVFCDFVKPLPALQAHLTESGIGSVLVGNNIDGALREFKTNPAARVFLATTGKCSTGLNIIEANHVLFLTPPLSANVYQQAVDRCYRIGQTKPVTVIDLLTEDSADEYLSGELRKKITAIDAFYDKRLHTSTRQLKEALSKTRLEMTNL